MTTTQLTEHVVTVSGKPLFVTQAGTGPAVGMLHGGGPGASGVSNYSRNIDALARTHRVIAPDMLGHGFTRPASDAPVDIPAKLQHLKGLADALGMVLEPAHQRGAEA